MAKDAIWGEVVTTGFRGGERPLLLQIIATRPSLSRPLFSTKDHIIGFINWNNYAEVI